MSTQTEIETALRCYRDRLLYTIQNIQGSFPSPGYITGLVSDIDTLEKLLRIEALRALVVDEPEPTA